MYVISHELLCQWLTGLLADWELIAPTKDEAGMARYQPVAGVNDIDFAFERTVLSPKQFFLPATEKLLTIERTCQPASKSVVEAATLPAAVTAVAAAAAVASAADCPVPTAGSSASAEPAAKPGGETAGEAGDQTAAKTAGPLPPAVSVRTGIEVTLREPEWQRQQVLFGIRPCDARALLSLDALLLAEPVDSYYARRREATVLIGLACDQMAPSCFCTSLGSSPDDPTGLDILLSRQADGYVMTVLTDKGRGLTGGLELEPYEGPSPQREWAAPEFAVAPHAVWTARFEDSFWNRLADRCLSCRLCAYVCPTCRCFDVRDYTVARGPGREKIERLRCWDSCLSEGYRCAAGGHNPRPTKAQRLRNRFYCKFVYYPADFGPLACVGCGRCIDLCPTNIDITEVLAAVQAASEAPES